MIFGPTTPAETDVAESMKTANIVIRRRQTGRGKVLVEQLVEIDVVSTDTRLSHFRQLLESTRASSGRRSRTTIFATRHINDVVPSTGLIGEVDGVLRHQPVDPGREALLHFA